MASNEYIIDSIKKVARETLPPKSSLLLFGSRARHEEHANSDWDILILLDKPQLTSEDYEYAYPFRVLGGDMNEVSIRKCILKKNGRVTHIPHSI